MPEPHADPVAAHLLAALALLTGAVGYLAAATAAHRRGRWPAHRGACWLGGLAVLAIAGFGPPGGAVGDDFTAHMARHLLLGMLAPLLLVLAAPVTLALRTMPVPHARRLSRLLRTRPVRYLTRPLVAAVLNVGGSWLLYTTALYPAAGAHPALHLAVHAHLLIAGYLMTFSIVGVDPAPHRSSPGRRAVVLVAFLAAHAILAKYLYAHPPAGVPVEDGQRAAMLMYYGGDVVDLGLIVAFCRQWYVAARPRRDAGDRGSPVPQRPASGPDLSSSVSARRQSSSGSPA
jgi:putative membrane protein